MADQQNYEAYYNSIEQGTQPLRYVQKPCTGKNCAPEMAFHHLRCAVFTCTIPLCIA
jgi:hypothetical protein